jgi:hypothetical protein
MLLPMYRPIRPSILPLVTITNPFFTTIIPFPFGLRIPQTLKKGKRNRIIFS